MKCDKTGYSKHHIKIVREVLYKKSGRKVKLRIYFCKDCFQWHMTKDIGYDEWVDYAD